MGRPCSDENRGQQSCNSGCSTKLARQMQCPFGCRYSSLSNVVRPGAGLSTQASEPEATGGPTYETACIVIGGLGGSCQRGQRSECRTFWPDGLRASSIAFHKSHASMPLVEHVGIATRPNQLHGSDACCFVHLAPVSRVHNDSSCSAAF